MLESQLLCVYTFLHYDSYEYFQFWSYGAHNYMLHAICFAADFVPLVRPHFDHEQNCLPRNSIPDILYTNNSFHLIQLKLIVSSPEERELRKNKTNYTENHSGFRSKCGYLGSYCWWQMKWANYSIFLYYNNNEILCKRFTVSRHYSQLNFNFCFLQLKHHSKKFCEFTNGQNQLIELLCPLPFCQQLVACQ